MTSKFITRLLYYLTGFGLGIIVVMILFQNRSCTWTPKNRVREDITSRVVVIGDDFKAEIQKRGITKEMVRKVLTQGKVDFDASQKHQNPKVYNLYDDHLKLNFSLPEYSFVSELNVGFKRPKNFKNSKHGIADLYLFPKDKNLIFIDSTVRNSSAYLKIGEPSSKDLLKALKETGQINFDKCNFKARPKVEQYLMCKIYGNPIGMKAVWYREKINIYEIELLQPQKME